MSGDITYDTRRSASRHLDTLKAALLRNTSTVVELLGRGGSVMFSAYRDESQTFTEQNFVTFSGCHVNTGAGFSPKTGMFQCPEAGSYLFLVTVATHIGRQCHVSLLRNGKVVAAMVDTRDRKEGPGAGGVTTVSQHCLLELDTSDKVQLAAEPGVGISDKRELHFSQFAGLLLRPSQDSFKAAVKTLAEDDGLSFSEGFRGLTPSRGTTPVRGFTPGNTSRGMTPLSGEHLDHLLTASMQS